MSIQFLPGQYQNASKDVCMARLSIDYNSAIRLRRRGFDQIELCFSTNDKIAIKKRLKIHLNQYIFNSKHHQMRCGIKINPLLHWSSPIRGDILLATARKISLRIGENQCNNGLVHVYLFNAK